VSNFGPIIGGWTVEKDIGACVVKWIATYIHEIEDNEGIERGSIPAPEAYTRLNNFRRMPEDPAPAFLVVSPGLIGEPVREGHEYSAKWQVQTGIIANSPAGQDQVRDLAQYYAAAIRTVMIQKLALESDIVQGVEWSGENYQDIGSLNERSHAAARDVFRVEVGGVLAIPGGPAVPDPVNDSPHPDDPVAETVTTTIIQEEIT
jgi:hypothetical protein